MTFGDMRNASRYLAIAIVLACGAAVAFAQEGWVETRIAPPKQ